MDGIQNREDRDMAHAQYTKARNNANLILRKAKRAFERGIARESKMNPKMFCYHVRRELKTKSGVAPLLADIKDKNPLKYDDKEKAEVLQNQFSSEFTRETDGTIPKLSNRTESFLTNMHVSEAHTKFTHVFCQNWRISYLNQLLFFSISQSYTEFFQENGNKHTYPNL